MPLCGRVSALPVLAALNNCVIRAGKSPPYLTFSTESAGRRWRHEGGASGADVAASGRRSDSPNARGTISGHESDLSAFSGKLLDESPTRPGRLVVSM